MNIANDEVIEYTHEVTNDKCIIHLIHVQIDDIETRASEMINRITNTSWLRTMDCVERIAFDSCSKRTIKKFVDEILTDVHGSVSSDFGEIMISDTAQCVLNSQKKHIIFPLADIFKERVS